MPNSHSRLTLLTLLLELFFIKSLKIKHNLLHSTVKNYHKQKRSTVSIDRELLAIYSAIRHFRHMVEGRHFVIYTDHKPLIYALLQDPLKSSPRQARHLEFISQFTSDIRHITGKENIVADALLRINSISKALDCEKLAKAQNEDKELTALLKETSTSMKLARINIPGTTMLYCDLSTNRQRPFVTAQFRKQVFQSLHGLSHPGIRATIKLIT